MTLVTSGNTRYRLSGVERVFETLQEVVSRRSSNWVERFGFSILLRENYGVRGSGEYIFIVFQHR